MRTYIILLILMRFVCVSTAQGTHVYLNLGLGTSKADIRGLRVPIERDTNKNNLYTIDNEYFIAIHKALLDKENYLLKIGFGYHFFSTNFPYVIEQIHFKVHNRRLFFSYTYNKQDFQFPISFYYRLLGNGSKIYLGSVLEPHLSFNKTVYLGRPPILGKFSRTLLEPSQIGLYPSFKLVHRSFEIELAFRALFFKFQDKALENNGKIVDCYNPTNFRLSIGYQLK